MACFNSNSNKHADHMRKEMRHTIKIFNMLILIAFCLGSLPENYGILTGKFMKFKTFINVFSVPFNSIVLP